VPPPETSTQTLMRLAKARQGIPSNYKLRQVLQVCEPTVTRWNQGRGAPTNALAIRMARMAEIDPALVLARISADRAQDEEEREIWLHVVARLSAEGV